MFPAADIPVVAMSADGMLSPLQMYGLGRRLTPLRGEGILILTSGAAVHNLRALNPYSTDGSAETRAFMDAVVSLVAVRDDEALANYALLPCAQYAVPAPDHYVPLIYALGASEGEPARVFSNVPQLGSTALTSFVFGPEGPA